MPVAAAKLPSPEQIGAPELTLIQGGGETSPPTGILHVVGVQAEDFWLSNIDDLGRYVLDDGVSYEPKAVKSLLNDKTTAVKEGAMPYARSKVDQEWVASDSPEQRGGLIKSLGRTAVENAEIGERLGYRSDEGRARGRVEVERAEFLQQRWRTDRANVMLSLKMTEADASLEVAKAEGLAETDSIQIDWLTPTEGDQNLVAMTETILVADVGIDDWVAMLADPNNLIGKAVPVNNPKSALSVMKTFRELEVPLDKLPEGPVSILAAVLPYIQDKAARAKGAAHLEKFRGDQVSMHRQARCSATRWLNFDMSIEQSRRVGWANTEIEAFIESLQDNWGEEDASLIAQHRIVHKGRVQYKMSRALELIIEKAQANFILTAAAVVVKNEKVLAQLPAQAAQRIHDYEVAVQAYIANTSMMHIAANNRLIASLNVKVGGCCGPAMETNFRSGPVVSIQEFLEANRPDTARTPKGDPELSWHGGVIQDGTCKNCSEHTKVGKEKWCHPCISNPDRAKKVVEFKQPTKSRTNFIMTTAQAA